MLRMTTPSQDRGPSAPAAADPRPRFRHAAEQAVDLLGALTPADLERPTPCTEYDVRALAGHLLTVLRRIEHVATGGSPFDVPQIVTGVADDAWAATARADADRLASTWSQEGVLDRMLTLPWGTLPGRAAAMAYTQELATHAWDLAVATGRSDRLDPAVAEAVLEPARRFVPAQGRGGHVPFGPVVEAPAGAGPYERLVAWLGRDPAWTPTA
jgi:uncharacterized protein (TIGR03086 family)